jgi:hypothetical protein
MRWELNFLNIALLSGFEGIKGHFDVCTSTEVKMHPFPFPIISLHVYLHEFHSVYWECQLQVLLIEMKIKKINVCSSHVLLFKFSRQ